jgi:drug/metabolite transporter (DMT)-like permease
VRPLAEGRRHRWTWSQLAVIAVVGLADMIASLLHAYTTRTALLPVVSVLSSLYPLVTVLLARWIDRERLRPRNSSGSRRPFSVSR